MRKILSALGGVAVAVCAVLAMSGTANAAVSPSWGGNNDIQCTAAGACTQGGVAYTGATTACVTYPCRLDSTGALDADPAHGHLPGGLGGGFPGNLGGGLYGGGFNDGLGGFNGGFVNGLDGFNLNGQYLVLDGGVQANVCQLPTWPGFVNQWGGHLNSLRAQLNQLRYEQLVAQTCNNGGLNGFPLNALNGTFLNLDQLGLAGAGSLNICQAADVATLQAELRSRVGVSRWGVLTNRYSNLGATLQALRLRAACNASQVSQFVPISTVAPAPAAAAPTAVAPERATVEAPTAADPSTGSGVVSSTPKGAPATGDGSTTI